MQDPHCIICHMPVAQCECAKEPEPLVTNPALLHPEIANVIYKAYLPHTRNRKKAAEVATRVLQMVLSAYEEELKNG